jgi:uncharacterized membrane protein
MSSMPPADERSLLLVGESWFSHSIHQKGFDSFTTSTYEEGCAEFVSALESRQWTVEHIPSHLVDTKMPSTLEALRQHAVVVLSDVGSNTFLLGRQTFLAGQVSPDLLELIAAYTSDGGGLVMVGGYMSFSGIDGKAGYGKTRLQDVLPVTVSASDDRVEKPAGVVPCVQTPDHPTVAGITGAGITGAWPRLLGYNRLTPRPHGQVVVTCGEDPLLVAGTYGEGRCVAFASDMGPHWAPEGFISWDGYPELWDGIASWAAGFDR